MVHNTIKKRKSQENVIQEVREPNRSIKKRHGLKSSTNLWNENVLDNMDPLMFHTPKGISFSTDLNVWCQFQIYYIAYRKVIK